MYEELYIIDNGQRLRVDLSIPSGITLNFKSNIFGDLSKITCSHTYTFKLPLTANNRRVLDNADDVRCISNKIRRRLSAEYLQDGIPLFTNANLYIESTDTCFNAVMTWDVIDGLQSLKDNDISIRELPLVASPIFGPCNSHIDEYSNISDYVQPLYNAGYIYINEYGFKGWRNKTCPVFPLPVVPVYRLIQLINTKYGTKFKFGTEYHYGDATDNHKIVSVGVIPCVNATQSASMIQQNEFENSIGIKLVNGETLGIGVNHLFVGNKDDFPTNKYFILVRDGDSGCTLGVTNKTSETVRLTIDGYLSMQLFCYWEGNDGRRSTIDETPMRINYHTDETRLITPKLCIYVEDIYGNPKSAASVEGRYGALTYVKFGQISYENGWHFNFSEEFGGEPVEVVVPPHCSVYIGLDTEDAPNLQMVHNKVWQTLSFSPSMSIDDINTTALDEENAGSFEMDLMSNLPDISCMTLVKALFFMLGAFPSINSAGEIIPVYYTALRDNIIAGNAVDWSQKMTTEYSALPTRMTYSISGFGQRNLYMMKNDNADGEVGEDETDVYAPGKGIIYVDNEVIDRNKTIIQLPFYGPFVRDMNHPKLYTGNTMKFWYLDNNEIKSKEAKPCFGIIKPLVQMQHGDPTGVEWMGMEVWNEFATITTDDSYSYLSKIMTNPIVVEEKLNLNEHDLRNIDYSVPVYLAKYGAYFAIVSITRDSKRVCKCELLKLPEEE